MHAVVYRLLNKWGEKLFARDRVNEQKKDGRHRKSMKEIGKIGFALGLSNYEGQILSFKVALS